MLILFQIKKISTPYPPLHKQRLYKQISLDYHTLTTILYDYNLITSFSGHSYYLNLINKFSQQVYQINFQNRFIHLCLHQIMVFHWLFIFTFYWITYFDKKPCSLIGVFRSLHFGIKGLPIEQLHPSAVFLCWVLSSTASQNESTQTQGLYTRCICR